MPYNPDIHQRRSIRLSGHDYSQPGAYFITICAKDKECLFGDIVAGEMQLNALGRIVVREWLQTGRLRSNVRLDQWVVMPNHMHGIVFIVSANTPGQTIVTNNHAAALNQGHGTPCPYERFGQPVSGSIPTIIRSFKSSVTKQINAIRQTPRRAIWQRNYYDHIIRDEADLHRIREYIQTNPARWELDSLYRETP